MAIAASCRNKLKPVQYVEVSLRVQSLFCVVTDDLTDMSQLAFAHSPFPIFTFMGMPK
jgi:hypothetical protein